jgi:hypothetical protein
VVEIRKEYDRKKGSKSYHDKTRQPKQRATKHRNQNSAQQNIVTKTARKKTSQPKQRATKHRNQNSAQQNIATKTAWNKTEIKLNCHRELCRFSVSLGCVGVFVCYYVLQQRAISSRAVVVALFCRALFGCEILL